MAQEITKATGAQLATSIGQKFSEELARYDLSLVKSMSTAIAANTPAIGSLARRFGDYPVVCYIAGHITALRDFVNLRGAMTDDQTDMTAEMMLDEFPNLTIADVALVLRRAKLGQFGPLYGRLDGQVILSWFSQYFDERCEYFAQKSEIEAHGMKGSDYGIDGRTKQLINSIMKNHTPK